MKHRLEQVALSPVLLAQAIWVRRHALRLAEPSGARSGSDGQGPVMRLLIVGDSSAAGVGAPSQAAALSGQTVDFLARYAQVDWQLIARTGWTTRDALDHVRQCPATPFDVALVALGVNDVTRLVRTRTWAKDCRELRDVLRLRFGVRRIYASTVPQVGRFPLLPRPLARVLGTHADLLRVVQARELQCDEAATLLDPGMPLTPALMAQDGFHPNAKAYAIWGQKAAMQIAADLTANVSPERSATARSLDAYAGRAAKPSQFCQTVLDVPHGTP